MGTRWEAESEISECSATPPNRVLPHEQTLHDAYTRPAKYQTTNGNVAASGHWRSSVLPYRRAPDLHIPRDSRGAEVPSSGLHPRPPYRWGSRPPHARPTPSRLQ